MKTPKDKSVTFRMPERSYARINREAIKRGVPVSQVLREMASTRETPEPGADSSPSLPKPRARRSRKGT